MRINKLFENEEIKKLPPAEFKALLLFYNMAQTKVIKDFTIRGTLRIWQEHEKDLNMPTSKNKVKDIIRNLEEKGFIKNEDGIGLRILI